MDTQKLNTWLSLGANLGVLIGIVFLAIEIRQNTEMTRVQIIQNRADAAISMAEATFNSEYLPGIVAKARRGEHLSDEEALRYTGWIRAALRNQDNNLQQYNQGMLGSHIPRSSGLAIENLVVDSARGRSFWEQNKDSFSDGFVVFVDALIAENDAGQPR